MKKNKYVCFNWVPPNRKRNIIRIGYIIYVLWRSISAWCGVCVLRVEGMARDAEFDLSFAADSENGMQTVQYDKILLVYSIGDARNINQTISLFRASRYSYLLLDKYRSIPPRSVWNLRSFIVSSGNCLSSKNISAVRRVLKYNKQSNPVQKDGRTSTDVLHVLFCIRCVFWTASPRSIRGGATL